jgi:drug/metabolite transporter (DMT)-like permease
MSLPITYLLVVLTAVMWGANFNLSKPVLAELHPLVAGADRYLIAAAIMLALAYFRGERVPLRHGRIYLTLGIVGVFGFNLFFFLGMASTSPVNGALIMALNPMLTSLIAYAVLGDKPSLRQLFAFPVGMVGVAIVVLGGGAQVHVAIGDVYIMIANISWAFYNVLVKKLMPADTSSVASTAGIMVVGALALSLAAVLAGERFTLPTAYAGSALLAMSVGGGVLAYLFWNVGIGRLGAARAAMFLNLVPLTSMLISALSGTPVTHSQLFGGALVIGAVTFSALPGRRQGLPSAR